MKRKRIQYNELNEEIYSTKFWSTSKLSAIGVILLLIGFLFNFSIEDKINKWLFNTLSKNTACPILFEKSEISYLLPEIVINKPIIIGSCFGQMNKQLALQNIKLSLGFPNFNPPGIKLHLAIKSEKTIINIYPIFSFFSKYIEIENTKIDAQLFSVTTHSNKSPIQGIFDVAGKLKISEDMVNEGNLIIKSENFYIPAQNLNNFELATINLKHLSISTHFTNKTTLQIDHIEIGQAGKTLELKLKGNLLIDQNNFLNSVLELNGKIHFSNDFLTNFAFLKILLHLPNDSGTYQMAISGPLNNLWPPKFN